MRAVVCQQSQLRTEDVPDPVPGPGQVLLEVTRCGICGSDLHMRRHADVVADMSELIGLDGIMRVADAVVMGHEFCGRVLSYGPGTRQEWRPGQLVVSLPMVRRDGRAAMTGLSAEAPGGYAEKILVQESLTMAVPDGVAPDAAAMTEPLAVAWHAVRRGRVGRRDTAVVIGCGPIGLAVILMLKARGVRTVVASDLSAARRELAVRCGADVVVDPAVDSPWASFQQTRHVTDARALLDTAFDAMEKLRRIPRLPWAKVLRAADAAGAAVPSGPVVFECVGVPGVIEQIVTGAPLRSRVVVVGVCMEPDTFQPAMAINKEIDLRFVFAYDPAEFHDTLQMIASGKVDPTPLVTGTVGLDDVADAFESLASAEHHAKILIDPTR
ncbi:zinc-binding dehydrogenase [Nocardioides terrisoli]|uniref:zinc-binding dehydrogenase n=1 Tax=Nocardioides terrisoli TaxID=3388267 RepID=UPI00287B68A7|nr:zinc-binding dehydrogenase [Nocardioides marmorisolisilvae]